jgi:hypothetical protein
MCFSAGASFGASAVLSIIGATAVIKARTIPQGLFAGIPFIFSIQQAAEGMLWLSINNTGFPGQSFYTYVFLVFALMVWPIWIPFTIRLLEQDSKRKKIMTVLLYTGVFVSAGIGCFLFLYPVEVVPTHHHLHYSFRFSPAAKNLIWLFSILFIASTIITPFVSGTKRMKWLGIFFIAAYLFAIVFYGGFVVSVWCYFAAILSIVVLWILPVLAPAKPGTFNTSVLLK